MRRLSLILGLVISLGAGCSEDESDSGGGDSAKTGCLQGVIINGMTGDRIDLPNASDGIGLYVLVQGSLKSFSPITTDPAASNMKRGEYTLCGVPLDEAFPVLGWFEGFAPYESSVIVDSTRAARSPNAEYDLVKTVPTEIFNIALFPQETDAKDLVVNVYHHGAPLKDATVYLRPTGRNFLDPNGALYRPSLNVRTKAVSGVSNDKGVVTFAAADLVLGGRYTYTVLPPGGGENHTATSGVFTLGLREDTTPADTTEPYTIHVDLDHTLGSLFRLSTSNDNNDPAADGVIKIYYNREIQSVPGSLDQASARLTGNVTAELKAPVADNKKTDEFKLEISGNVLTLTPQWETKPDTVVTNEINLTIIYENIQIRPKNSPEQAGDLTESFSVGFYR